MIGINISITNTTKTMAATNIEIERFVNNASNYRAVLGIPLQCKRKEMQKHYHTLMKKYHPDRCSDKGKRVIYTMFTQNIIHAKERLLYDEEDDSLEDEPQGGGSGSPPPSARSPPRATRSNRYASADEAAPRRRSSRVQSNAQTKQNERSARTNRWKRDQDRSRATAERYEGNRQRDDERRREAHRKEKAEQRKDSGKFLYFSNTFCLTCSNNIV